MKAAFFDVKPYEKEYLEKNCDFELEKIFFPHSINCDTELDEKTLDCEILSVFITSSLSKKVLEKFKNLKFIVLRSVGFSHVDLSYAKEKGINIFNAPHYGDHSIAEYTFALLLNVSRKTIEASIDIKNQTIDDNKYQGIELFNKTIGVIGTGAIGKKVVQIARAFNMNVLCHDINQTEGYEYVSFDELLKNSDIISINCPLNENTLHMFNENAFNKMKKGVVIINTARGEIIDTYCLYKALKEKIVSYAAMDVMECEDVLYENKENKIDINLIKEKCFKNHYVAYKLLNMKNVLITPHIAYNTKEAATNILKITVENLKSSIKFTTGAKNLILL